MKAPDNINLTSSVFVLSLLRTITIINIEIVDVEVKFVRESLILREPIFVSVEVEDTRNADDNDW